MSIRYSIERRQLVLAILIPLVAFGLQWLFWPFLRPAVWILFYPAVFLCAWLCGLTGALIATCISTSIVWYCFIPPEFSLALKETHHLWAVGVFTLMGGVFGFFLDRLKQAEQNVADAKFRSLVDQSLAGIYILQADRFRYVNKEFANIFGYQEPSEIIDQIPVSALVAREDQITVSRNVSRRETGGEKELRYTFTGIRKDGRLIVVEVHGCSFQYEGLPAVIGVILDITERVEIEKKLRQANTVFISTQEGFAITDLNANILVINPAFSVITEYTEAEALGRNLYELRADQDHAFHNAPLHAVQATGSWQGEVWNRRKSGDLYPAWMAINAVRDENGDVVNYVVAFTDVSRMQHPETQLERLAHHDALTGLPNRLLLHSRLEHAVERVRRYGGQGAVLFVDLDRFKQVNDTLGHQAGDELLVLVAGRLKNRLRENDTLARLGGDEFVIVLEDVSGAADVAVVAEDLITQLRIPFLLFGKHEVEIGGSIGIAVFPRDGEDTERLIGRADAALRKAKDTGRGVFLFFTTD
ncbi:MAG: diguanylate cyclase domain-containing protein [Acidobacteriota bacterium]